MNENQNRSRVTKGRARFVTLPPPDDERVQRHRAALAGPGGHMPPLAAVLRSLVLAGLDSAERALVGRAGA